MNEKETVEIVEGDDPGLLEETVFPDDDCADHGLAQDPGSVPVLDHVEEVLDDSEEVSE